MAESAIAGLFQTPEMYQQLREQQARQQAMEYAQLTPQQRVMFDAAQAGQQIGRGLGQLFGVEDPQLKMISQRNALARQIDPNNPQSYIDVAKMAAQSGDPQFAMSLTDAARAAMLTQSQIVKNLQAPKLTGDERYINILRSVETHIANGGTPTSDMLSQANIAAQMLSKPRTYYDAASGQTVSVPATNPSTAFPNVFRAFTSNAPQNAPPSGPVVTQTTPGNLPTPSQQQLAEIEGTLAKLNQSEIDLSGFVSALKKGDVKYNASSNLFDFLGAVVPPAFGFSEQGNQVRKDEINRALKERVNTLLLQAKGTQTEGDAKRAESLIASDSTYLSQERMVMI